ncbi:unnamed protein product [Rotaria magnacalcarata]|nr:unnamed protein product [Rotaria magnacalcarata]
MEALHSDQFLGKSGQRTLFSIECVNGKSVAKHSYFKNTEKEIILLPGSYFEVISQLNSADELHIIHLKELTPPIELVKPPFSKSTKQKIVSIASNSTESSSPTSMKEIYSPQLVISPYVQTLNTQGRNEFYIFQFTDCFSMRITT